MLSLKRMRNSNVIAMSKQSEWYISFHGGTDNNEFNNIHVYSNDGRELRKALDRDHLPPGVELRELRGFTFGPDGSLYVANAFREFSQVLRFDGKLDKQEQHRFTDMFVSSDAATNPGLSHPYAVTFDARGDLYVSSQNTNLVLRYHGPDSKDGKSGAPMPPASALGNSKSSVFSPGTFCAASSQVPHGLQAVRGAAFIGGLLYVVDRDSDCVRKFDPATGADCGSITADGLIDKPIQAIAHEGTLYIGNRGADSVVKCDLRSEKVTPFIQSKAGGLKNPSGMAVGDDGWFYVASRSSRQILRYRFDDGFPGDKPFIDKLDDDPEFLVPVNRH